MSFSSYETTVVPEWIDYNGHMSEPFYVLIFGYATDEAMAAVGLGPEYREASGCSLYTVEAHVRYLNEVGLGERLRVTTEIVGVAAKKLHLAHTMWLGDAVIATEEILGIHVDQGAGSALPLPDPVEQAARAALQDAPSWAGRSVAV